MSRQSLIQIKAAVAVCSSCALQSALANNHVLVSELEQPGQRRCIFSADAAKRQKQFISFSCSCQKVVSQASGELKKGVTSTSFHVVSPRV